MLTSIQLFKASWLEGKSLGVAAMVSYISSPPVSLQHRFSVILIGTVTGRTNQAEISSILLESTLKWSWCKNRLSHSILDRPTSTVFANECLTFVVSPLCVHPVKTVKQSIDLCLYQSQLLFNHLQLLHAHCQEQKKHRGQIEAVQRSYLHISVTYTADEKRAETHYVLISVI